MTPAADDGATASLERRVLLWLLAAVSLALGWILVPFYGAILWGWIIALLFAPLHHWLLARLRGKVLPATLLTLLVALLIVVLPVALVGAALAREAALAVQHLQSGEFNPLRVLRGLFDALPASVASLLERWGGISFDSLQRSLANALAQGSRIVASQALGIGHGTFDFLVSLCVAVYLAFFLIRDADSLSRAARRAVPLTPAHQQELFDIFNTVLRATVKGNLLVATIQGALGGFAFWWLGINAALLWGVLMAFLSLLPAVGAALVWLPVAAYLLLTGEIGPGLGLIAYGVLVIGLVDNLLRPALVGKDTRMPDYVVLLTTLGGMSVLGINGFVLGPVIAAMFVAVWHIHATSLRGTGSSR
jgi:predicted PurR-regulated permease PerM